MLLQDYHEKAQTIRAKKIRTRRSDETLCATQRRSGRKETDLTQKLCRLSQAFLLTLRTQLKAQQSTVQRKHMSLCTDLDST